MAWQHISMISRHTASIKQQPAATRHRHSAGTGLCLSTCTPVVSMCFPSFSPVTAVEAGMHVAPSVGVVTRVTVPLALLVMLKVRLVGACVVQTETGEAAVFVSAGGGHCMFVREGDGTQDGQQPAQGRRE